MAEAPGEHSTPRTTPELDSLQAFETSELTQEINTEQMFRLIESILPFEACLYHQVLPLSVEDSHLNLGMVDPHDREALEYVRRFIGYINCTLVPHPISSNVHQAMLSAYLNYSDVQRRQAKRAAVHNDQLTEQTGQPSQRDSGPAVAGNIDPTILEPIRLRPEVGAAQAQDTAQDTTITDQTIPSMSEKLVQSDRLSIEYPTDPQVESAEICTTSDQPSPRLQESTPHPEPHSGSGQTITEVEELPLDPAATDASATIAQPNPLLLIDELLADQPVSKETEETTLTQPEFDTLSQSTTIQPLAETDAPQPAPDPPPARRRGNPAQSLETVILEDYDLDREVTDPEAADQNATDPEVIDQDITLNQPSKSGAAEQAAPVQNIKTDLAAAIAAADPLPPTVATPLQPPAPPPMPPVSSQSRVPVLNIEAYYLSSPIEVIKAFPPRNLLHELLGRVLLGGIGRLYFEHQEETGRILWSQSGVLQSVLDQLPTEVFEQVVDELKILAEIPRTPVQQAQHVELERIYKHSRLLLRFRFMPGRHGETVTLQVLRGEALKFYEQQKVDRLGSDALSIAQQLQQKLDEIRNHRRGDVQVTNPDSQPGTSLEALQRMLTNLNQQLKDLESGP
ncbi:MAG: hypothetical protein AAGF24_04225 [Cyanobacteria bacterium P01_H01_bin.121]